jgi:hypothetical protein
LWYAGKFNLDAVLAELSSTHALSKYNEIILSGCSAGGMACYIHCDSVAKYFSTFSPPVPVKCVCDAGVFLDVPTVTGQGNVMRKRFFDVADRMHSKPGLPAACVAAAEKKQQEMRAAREEAAGTGASNSAGAVVATGSMASTSSFVSSSPVDDWRLCIFSEVAMRYTQTPLFSINSQYNFGEWEILAPTWMDTTAPPPDWAECWPRTGGLTVSSFAKCNATQKAIIANQRVAFLDATAAVWNVSGSGAGGAGDSDSGNGNGAFLDSCPSQHCQSGWNGVSINGSSIKQAVSRWYFNGSVERHVDGPFLTNPTCPQHPK